MDQTGRVLVAEPRQMMRKERIYCDTCNRIFRRRVLLNNANAIDDDVGLYCAEYARHTINIFGANVADRLCLIEDPIPAVFFGHTPKGDISIKVRPKGLPKLVPQHPRPAQYQNLHGILSWCEKSHLLSRSDIRSMIRSPKYNDLFIWNSIHERKPVLIAGRADPVKSR